jgi:cobalt-zinc-cadmium efflux system membrane fusion protein
LYVGNRTVAPLLALLLAVVLATATTSCKDASATKNDSDAGPQGPRVVKLDPAAVGRLGVKVDVAGAAGPSRTLHVNGTLDYDYDQYAEVGVPLEGRVTRVDVKVSDHVKKGQTLASIVVPSVAAAQADYLQAQAAVTAARKNRDREEDLLSRQLTTAREAEVARSEAAKAEADLAAASARLNALRVGIPQSDSMVAAAGTLALTAPIEGVVVARKANLGVFLTPSDTAFVVADLSELWASLEVHESDIGYLKIGADVELAVDALAGKTFKGKLALIEPALSKASRAARARVVVDNASMELRPGLFLRASISLPNDAPGRLFVPAGAVQPLADDDVVFIERSPGNFEVRTVKVARRTPDVVEISEGLANGERIVVENAFLLRGEVTNQ